jgi:K+-sensing histidine kinase KdpD
MRKDSATRIKGGDMHRNNTESLFFLSAGPLGAILLGAALVPLRGITSASNLSFVFMALTILVAEHGGRRAAVATALCSALSLDFFLTQPYLRLTIADKHDLIAFVGLGACGLIAAAFGVQRGERVAALREARKQLEMLDAAIGGLQSSDSLETRLGKVLDAVRGACPVACAVIRDEGDRVLAATEDGNVAKRAPVQILASQTLLPRGADADNQAQLNTPFPLDGARLALMVGNRRFGWLDLWGNGLPADAQARRALSDAAHVMALQLAAVDAASRNS